MTRNQHKIEQLQALWFKRPKALRCTETHILMFKNDVAKTNPVLLNLYGLNGDVYGFLKTVLQTEV